MIEAKKQFKKYSDKFIAIRPVFAGQPKWMEYKRLNELHLKLSTKKLSKNDYQFALMSFINLLYEFTTGKKSQDIKEEIIIG